MSVRSPAPRRILAAAVTGLTALPALGAAPLAVPTPVQAQTHTQAQVRDGEATPAACRALGFEIERRPPRLGGVRPMPAPGGAQNRVMAREQAAPAVVGAVSPPAPPPPGVIAPPRPAAQDTERYPDATPNPVRRTADQPVSTFSIDVDTASYSNVRRFINDGTAPPRDAVRVEEMINYFDYGYARPTSPDQPFALTTVTTAAPWAPDRQIVHIGLQGYELPESQRRPLNLTFLVDVSGSMNAPDKLDLAKQAMNLVIDRLRPQDTVAVTYYAEGAGTTLQPTAGTDKLRIRCAVASLHASGGTAGATGMTNAYDQAQLNFARDRVNRILMFTDGDFNVGVTDNRRLEDYVADKRDTGIYLSVYGFGRGNYQDARMQTIAQAGDGVAAYVDSLNEARRLFGPRFDRGAFPIADDVKIQVEFNPAHVAEWRLIGYETRLLNEEDFHNDAVDAGEVGSGASVTALYEITPVDAGRRVPDRRYAANRPDARPADERPARMSGELGFIQVRYKAPGAAQSQLIQQAIPARTTDRPPEATRWALAVAAFGQRLRSDPWMAPGYGWDRVTEAAQSARGDDPWGERAEFVQLTRAAAATGPRRTP